MISFYLHSLRRNTGRFYIKVYKRLIQGSTGGKKHNMLSLTKTHKGTQIHLSADLLRTICLVRGWRAALTLSLISVYVCHAVSGISPEPCMFPPNIADQEAYPQAAQQTVYREGCVVSWWHSGECIMFVPADSFKPQKILLVWFLVFNRAVCACVHVLLCMIIP